MSRTKSKGRTATKLDTLLEQHLDQVQRTKPQSTAYACEKAIRQLAPIKSFTIPYLTEHPEHIFSMIESWEGLSLKTVRNYLGPLRAVFKRAYIKREITSNPLRDFSPGDLIAGKKTEYKVSPYNQDEIERILDVAGPWLNFFRFWFYTGLRTSEMYGLLWEDIGEDYFLVRNAVVEGRRKGTKTESSERRVQYTSPARQSIAEQRKASYMASEAVFTRPGTSIPLKHYRETSNVLRRLCKRAKVPYREQRQIRHSFASNMLSGGENPFRVAAMMGHKDVNMVMKVYGKWIEQGKASIQFESSFANKERRACSSPLSARIGPQ